MRILVGAVRSCMAAGVGSGHAPGDRSLVPNEAFPQISCLLWVERTNYVLLPQSTGSNETVCWEETSSWESAASVG